MPVLFAWDPPGRCGAGSLSHPKHKPLEHPDPWMIKSGHRAEAPGAGVHRRSARCPCEVTGARCGDRVGRERLGHFSGMPLEINFFTFVPFGEHGASSAGGSCLSGESQLRSSNAVSTVDPTPRVPSGSGPAHRAVSARARAALPPGPGVRPWGLGVPWRHISESLGELHVYPCVPRKRPPPLGENYAEKHI